MEVFMPGEKPGVLPKKLDYTYALAQTKELHANAVYLLTGDPDNLQPAFFQQARAQKLPIILGLWFSAEASDYAGHSGDFQNEAFKTYVKSRIRAFVDKYHNLDGTDYSNDILYATLGNEFLEPAIQDTYWRHRKTTSYKGKYVSVSDAHPVECFLAEMMDYYKTYEAERYGVIHYVSHHTWFPVSPKILKNRFLDVISYNFYSYWPPEVERHGGGSATKTPYQGALEEILALYPDKPFVVSEFGISVAPKNATVGTDEKGQAAEIAARWKDIVTANRYVAGGTVHQLFDQWWKDDNVGETPIFDELEHDPTDREEWFGLIEIEGSAEQPVYRQRPACTRLKELWGSKP
jgi:hypothetical protein